MESFINGAWYSVCGRSWTRAESTVVCRELGYTEAIASGDWRSFGRGGGPIKIGGVSCSGNEDTLLQCDYHSNVGGCGHSDDIMVVCKSEL